MLLVLKVGLTKGGCMTVREIREAIVRYFDQNIVEVFYPGVRGDVAIDLGIAPNSVKFLAAWGEVMFSTNGSRVIAE